MTRRLLLTAIAGLTASLTLVAQSPVLALGTIDQAIGSTAPFDSMSWLYSAQGGGQSFTAGLTGPLDSVTVFLKDGGSATAGLTMTVKTASAGLPTGAALATQFIPDSDIPLATGAVTVTFTTPPTVTAGQQYAVLLTTTASSSGNQHYELYYKTSTVYSGGTGLDDRGAGGAWRDLGFDNSLITYVTQASSGAPDASSAPVPDVHQAVGLPSTGTCASVSMPGLDWAAVATGGWTPSWAQWMNEGRGGFTCQRTLHYSDGHWALS